MVEKNSEKIQRPHFKFDLEYLAPCDFFFFPKIKNKMRGITFSSSSKAMEHYKNLVSEVSQEEWYHCYTEWFHGLQKCIDVKREHFEKH
jgi:hypothetical protein